MNPIRQDMAVGQARLSVLAWLCIVVIALGAFHEQSEALTPSEVVLGGTLVTLAGLGVASALLSPNRMPAPLRWALLLACWYLINAVLALANSVDAFTWLRFAFPALLLPFYMVLSYTQFRAPEVRRRLLLLIAAVGAAVIVVSLSGFRTLTVGDVTDLQSLRKFGGDFFAPFTVVATLPFVLTREGRRALPLVLGLPLLLIGLMGLAVSFTRTYWLSTGVSLVVLTLLLWRYCRRDFWVVAVSAPIAMSTIVATVLLRAPGNLLEMLAQRASDLFARRDMASFQERLAETLGLLHAQNHNPISYVVGNGFGATFEYSWVHTVTGEVFGAVPTQYSHDYYAYVLFTTGVLGLLLYVSMWISLFRNVTAHLSRERSAGGVMVPVRLAVLTISANLLFASITTPQFEEMQWTIIFGVILGLSIDPLKRTVPDRAGSPTGVQAAAVIS